MNLGVVMSDVKMNEDGMKGDGMRVCAEDGRVVDSILDGRCEVGSEAREARVRGWLKCLEGAKVEGMGGDLVSRTMGRVEDERMRLVPTAVRKEEAKREVSIPVRPFWVRYLREAGAMAVAASLLMMVVVLGVSQARQSAQRVACATNLEKFAGAFSAYGAANGGALPALADSADENWLRPNLGVKGAHSNVDNLLPLMEVGMIRPVNLLCAGRETMGLSKAGTFSDESRGYSYVNMFGTQRPKWDGSHGTIVMADRNPLFDTAAGGMDAEVNSANHGGRGEYTVRGWDRDMGGHAERGDREGQYLDNRQGAAVRDDLSRNGDRGRGG